MLKNESEKVEKVEEFEPGQRSYKEILESLKSCQARVYFLYARWIGKLFSWKIVLKLCFQQTRCWHYIPGGCGSEHDWSWIRLDCHRAGHTLVTIIVTRDMWHYRLCTRPIFPMVLSDSTWQAQTTRRLTSTTHCKMRRKLYIISCFFRQPHPGQRDQDPVWQGGGRRGSPEQL